MRKQRLQKVFGALVVSFVALAAGAPALLADAAMAMPDNKGFATIKEILANNCSACHDWTASYEALVSGTRVVPGKPDESVLWQKVSTDQMPAGGDPLPAEQKAFIRGWIAAGAPSSDLAIAVAAPDASAAAAPTPARSAFPGSVVLHEVSGFTSVALFAAAGALGVIHYLDIKNTVHANGVSEADGGAGEGDFTAMINAWGGQQAMRWWHVGFIISGETLYMGNAISGISMLTTPTPGTLTKHDIHRIAFFTHATLMAAQVVLGFLETDALSRGLHDEAIFYTGAHAVIGVAIPAVMLYAGIENILPGK
jgi:hypothetical protein